jgi:hypothetical protein
MKNSETPHKCQLRLAGVGPTGGYWYRCIYGCGTVFYPAARAYRC